MKHFDHSHEHAFELLTCPSSGVVAVPVKPEPLPRKRADYRTLREIEQYGALPQ